MANRKKVMDSIRNFLLKMKALDGDLPEELAKDALEMTEEVRDALCEDEEEMEIEEKEKEEVKDNPLVEEKIEKMVEDYIAKVLRKMGVTKDSAMSALDELEEELGKEIIDETGEEEVTVDPELINDSAEMIRKVKPIIASVKDAKQRKILSDSFAKAIGMKTNTADYASIYKSTKKTADENMKNVVNNTFNDYDYGMEIAKKWNPHYKEDR